MLKRTLIAWCLAPLLLTGMAFAAQRYHSAGAATRTVTTYSGEVNERTADRFVQLISHNVNRVIGLKVDPRATVLHRRAVQIDKFEAASQRGGEDTPKRIKRALSQGSRIVRLGT